MPAGTHLHSSNRGFLLVMVVLLAMAAVRPACACMSYELNSVHFNANKPDFGLLPRRASISTRGEHDSRPIVEDAPGYYSGNELDRDREQERRDKRKAETASAMARAESEAAAGRYGKAIRICEGLASRFGWSGTLRDLVETLRETEAKTRASASLRPNIASALAAYLKGMSYYEAGNYTESIPVFDTLYRDTPPGADTDFLRAHALYQQASLAYEWFDFRRAVDLFQQLLKEFPGTVKREAALIMIARCAILPATDESRRLTDGQAALATLRKEYPNSRFRTSAEGLRARIDWLEERYAKALRVYLAHDDIDSVEEVCRSLSGPELHRAQADLLAAQMRRLTTVNTYAAYERAIAGIDRLKKRLTSEDTTRFHRRLLNDLETTAAYLYYRLNHTENHAAETRRLARLADQLAARFPAADLPLLLQAEIGDVHYRQGQYDLAIGWASRCLRQYPDYDRALYVRGAALHKVKRLREASADFETLLRACSRSGLRAAAREEAARTAEAMGDWGRALSHYFALNYRLDIAYLLDVRMDVPRIEAYLRSPDARQPFVLPAPWSEEGSRKQVSCTRAELIAYSLGIRCLRQEKWDRAEGWLKRIPTTLYQRFSQGRAEWDSRSRPSPDPLTAIRELRALHRAVSRARTANAKALALFRYGSYYYSHGTLLLYNPALWRSERAVGFSMWWNDAALQSGDSAIVRDYMYEHEVYARSLKTCLDVAERYPSAAVAPQALYRAACASHFLANFNGWWRDRERIAGHSSEAIRLMKRLVRRYPRHPLAKEAGKYARVFKEELRGQ